MAPTDPEVLESNPVGGSNDRPKEEPKEESLPPADEQLQKPAQPDTSSEEREDEDEDEEFIPRGRAAFPVGGKKG